MVVFLCLPNSAIGYFLRGFLVVFGLVEAGVGIYAFCDVTKGDYRLLIFILKWQSDRILIGVINLSYCV